MNAKLLEQAKESHPEYYKNTKTMFCLDGVCVKSSCRNNGVLSYIIDTGEKLAKSLGFTHATTPIAAPEAMHVAMKHGYKVLSKITYCDSGAPFALGEIQY